MDYFRKSIATASRILDILETNPRSEEYQLSMPDQTFVWIQKRNRRCFRELNELSLKQRQTDTAVESRNSFH